LLVGLYLAFDPRTYLKGIIRLIPQKQRPRAEQVLHELGSTLTHWLIGRFFAMAFVGVFVALGLWLMGIHLALTLSIIASLLDFLPYLGPLVAVLPAILLGLLESPAKVFYIILLYGVVLSIEGYVFTPLVQQREVAVPPVLTLISQILMGLFFGILGLILATPLAACAVTIVKMLYVEDVLGDRSES
jgi:predicted PurR-regulated permease PerM